MSAVDLKLTRRLKLSGGLISSGLVVEALTVEWTHPTAFLAFLLVGGTLVALGAVLYLFTIASAGGTVESREP
jgi:hypothetical protein